MHRCCFFYVAGKTLVGHMYMQGEAVYLIVEGNQETYGLRDLAGKVISMLCMFLSCYYYVP